MADPARAAVSDDLDALRRALAPDDPLTPGLARFLAACGGTLRAQSTGSSTEDAAPEPDGTEAGS